MENTESIEKVEKHPEYSVKCHIVDKFNPNPKQSNVVLSVHDLHGNRIARAYFIHREHGVTAHNVEIKENHNHQKVFGLIKQHVEKITGKKIIPSSSI
jgi:hypothetical protein